MKRSEMLKLIRAELLGKPTGGNFEEEILTTVEKLGMSPPGIESKDGNLFDLVHEWEPEDEAKWNEIINCKSVIIYKA